ncbi:rhomboid family intramembrane serine protease, partial [Sinorhizobium medicae]
MFIPLHDRNELKHIRMQYVTIALILTNIVVWLVTVPVASEEFANAAILGLGYIPAIIFDYADLDPSLVIVPDGFTFLTYSFLHGDLSHLAMNMLFLWVFGDN